jgi:peptidyl-prolyl cis-trans isomerase D
LITLEEVHPATTQPFDDANEQKLLIETYQQRMANQLFRDNAEKLEQLAFENPSSLDAVTKGLNLKVQTTDWLARDSKDGIAKTPAVIENAFSSALLNDNENSKPLPVSATDLIVIRKADYQAPHQLAFDEVSARIRDQLKSDATKAKAKSAADAIEAAIKQGQTLEAATKAQGLTADAVVEAEREQPGTDAAMLKEVFQLPRPAAAKSSTGQVTLPQDVVAVVQLLAVKAPDAKLAASPDNKGMATMQKNMTAGAEFDAYRKALQTQVGVKTFADQTQGQ